MALVDTLASERRFLPDAKAKKPFYTLGDVKAQAQMDTLTGTLAEAEAEALGETSGDV